MSVTPRLNRLFGPDGKCCEVAIDHGVHNEPSFLAGIERMGEAINTIVAAGPDAILLGTGQAHFLQSKVGRKKPSLVLRSDPTNLYGIPTPTDVFCELLHEVVEQAVALDAVALVVNLIWVPDRPTIHRQCVANISRLKPQCERFGIPMMVEPLLMISDKKTGGYGNNPDTEKAIGLVRQAVELGADVVKTDPLENLEEYPRVIEAASGKPVLLRGGSRVSDNELLSRTYTLIRQGAAGVVYGRNVYQHPHPERMLRALSAIVHQNAGTAEAESILAS
jgi:class I fructose-bisphosphate aldolase